jgi:hypothetical protein
MNRVLLQPEGYFQQLVGQAFLPAADFSRLTGGVTTKRNHDIHSS